MNANLPILHWRQIKSRTIVGMFKNATAVPNLASWCCTTYSIIWASRSVELISFHWGCFTSFHFTPSHWTFIWLCCHASRCFKVNYKTIYLTIISKYSMPSCLISEIIHPINVILILMLIWILYYRGWIISILNKTRYGIFVLLYVTNTKQDPGR